MVTLARLTGAPVLTGFLFGSADYHHQVLEISDPVPVDGDPAVTFARCAAAVSVATTRSPGHWRYWASATDLAGLGLIRPDQERPVVRDPVAVPADGVLTGEPLDHAAAAG